MSRARHLSTHGIWHRLEVRDGKYYCKCNHAIGNIPRRKILWGYNVTCKNCLNTL